MHRRLTSLSMAAAVLLTMATLSSCSAEAPPEPSESGAVDSFAAIEDAARAEGQVTIYTSLGNEQVRNDLVATFEEQYPEITVNMIRLDSGPLTARVASEMEAGSPTADVMQLVDNILYDQEPDWFRVLTPENVPNIANWPARFVAKNGTYVHQQANEFIISYNSDQVSDVPDSWEDLANSPELSQAIMANPNSSASFMGWAMFIRDKLGDETLKKFGQNVGGFFESSATAAQQVAAGEVPIVFPAVRELTSAAVAQGAPVERITTTPTIGTSHIWALPKSEGGSPNAALVWLNFMLSKDAAAITCLKGDNMPVAYDDIPNCPIVGDDLALVADYYPDLTDTVRQEISSLLGL